ncbi:MAG TPA: hypothetical protein VGN75_09180 [Kaistia sp.]|jgi:hypothetical protein|nr:hypothetical protein [Kaistia sp.]
MGGWLTKWKGLFASERTWRIYVVLQLLGLAAITMMDILTSSWDALPRSGYGGLRWDVLDSHYYERYAYNWYFLLFLFGPTLSAKAFDWIGGGGSTDRKADAVADVMKSQMVECTDAIETKWRFYTDTLKFKGNVPLSDVMDGFSMPILTFVKDRYPLLISGGASIFWIMIFTAAMKSGTHQKDEVNSAVAVLQQKYGVQ